MAKKKIEELQIDEFFTTNPDFIRIDEIRKMGSIGKPVMDEIYELYKKYINPKALMYQVNCKCNTSISVYWNELLTWYHKNK